MKNKLVRYLIIMFISFVIDSILRFYLPSSILKLNLTIVPYVGVMMSGHKMKMFLLDLSFIGWAILCCFTLGIGFLFLAPYVEASHAAFYEDLKKELGESVEAISE